VGGGGNGGSSFYSSIIPGVDSTTGLPVYRLGGSGTNSGLYIGNAVLTNYNNKTSSVVIGADLINGNGQIKYGKAMTYTGSTTVNSASQLVIPYVYAAASNNIPTATNLILAGGQLDLQENGTSANTQTLAGVTINPGGSSNINMSGGGTTANLLNLNGVTRNPGGAVDFTEVGTQSATNGITTTTANSTGGIIGGWATVNQNTWAVSAGTGSGSGLITGLGSFTAANASTGTPTGTTSNIDFQASTTWGTATINSLRFGTAVAGTLTLSGTLTDVSGGIIEASGVGNNATVITGGTLMGGAGTDLIVNQYNTANTLAINSVITDNGSATGLTKSGSGTLILGGSNTFTGQTYDNGGTLTLSNSLALQNSTLNFNILAGGISFGGLTSATLGGLNGNQYVTLSGTAGSVALSVGNNNANTNYSGVMMGAGSLTKIGTATLTMSGVNTYTGGTNVNAGTLRVTGSLPAAGTVNVNGGGTLGGTGFVFGPVIVAGGSSATAQGTVSLVDGAIDAFNLSGGLTVGGTAAGSPSTLAFDINASSSDTLAANNFNVNAGGARIVINSLVLGSALSSGTTYTLMTFNSSSGAGFATGSGTTVGAISLASSMLTFGVSGVLDVNSNSIQVVTSVSQAPSTAYWSGVNGNTWNATDSTGNYGNFTTDPAGTNFIQSYPSSNTNVIFSANGNGAPANLNNTLGANFDINSLTFLSNNPATTIGGSQTLTLESGGITVQSGAGAVTLGMASLVLDQSQTWTNSSATPLMVTSNVSGTGTLTTNGNIDMTGTNNFSGGAIVSSGTLQLGTGSLNTTGNLTVDGTLDMNGSNVTVATLSGSGTITSIAAGNATLTSNANSDSTFSGNITDGGTGETLTLVKNGTNTLTLSGTNSYSGGTVLNAGSIMVGNATALGKNAPLTINAGTLDLQAAGSSSGGNQNISVGSLSGIGGTITDNNSNSGVTTLIVNQTANAAYNGLITDGGSRQLAVTKTGASKLILTSTSNSYSGGTMISAGQLLSAAPGTVGSGTVTLSGGSLALGTLTSFGGNGVGWTVNQTGSYNNVPTPITNDVLTLTDNESNQGRFAFFQSPQTISDTAGFTASFTYTPSGDKIADGVSFVIENDPRGSNAIGGTGGALGYSGITNSGAVEFNIYSGATIGTAFGTASNPLPGNTSVSPVALGSGDPIDVTLMYSKDALTEKLTDPTAGTTSTTTFNNVDFNSLLGGNTGYVGFTGSTGGSKSTQTISNFSFESLATSTWNNAILAANGTSSNLQVGVGNAVINGLTLQTGSSLSLSKGIASSAPQVLTTSGLTIAGNTGHWTATLDVGSTDLDVQNGSLGTITNMVQQGYSNGTWQGSGGITSSAAAADSTHLTALGVIQNTVDGSTPLYGSGTALGLFDGTSPAATNVLIKETYYGDTDLNGVVDGTDYSRIDNGALNHLTGWFNGDFNYDGVIDGSDYTLIDNAYNQQGASLAAAVATAQVATSNEGSSVPEPASIALLGISAIGLLGRRRSR
jgi:fibronectin-binding autotransporter adhesin